MSKFGDVILSGLRRCGPLKYKLPTQPKIIESVTFDVIHFPMQFGFATMYPSVYQPHDFQHLHLSKNFSKETMVLRNAGMGSMMQQASQIIVGAEWTRNDLNNFYPVYRERVLNVPVYPRPLLEDSGIEVGLIKQIGDYLFYPAMDWPHKNHSGLIKVFAKVTKSFPNLSLVLAGGNLSSNKQIATLVEVLGIANKVRFTGFLSEPELFHYYQNAKIMVMPSFFESESLPIWEAFMAKVPVLSAAITAIPAQVKSSAMLFDPNNDIDFYEKMVELLMNSELRSQLVELGIQRVGNLSAYNSALGYRFAYRRAAGKEIDDLDSSWFEKSFTF
jgi:glycosyltransferase involved in cell wall biosynthesis